MAQYDRRFLVPYLRDVCSTELLLIKQRQQYEKSRSEYYGCCKRVNTQIYRPSKPYGSLEVKKYFDWSTLLWAIGSGIIGILLLIFATGLLKALCIPFFWFTKFLIPYIGYREDSETVNKIERYQEEMHIYEQKEKRRQADQARLPSLKQQMEADFKRLDDLIVIRSKLYMVDVIPDQYRNVYAAHYLYRFFDTSQENDLEKVLQMFILEEIKAKLDVVIQQQTTIILNQRITMAKQDTLNQAIAEQRLEQKRSMAALERNNARRDQYLSMINTNLMLSNYLAYKNYTELRK